MVDRGQNDHKSIKDSGPSCPIYSIRVSRALSCVWPHSCLRDGGFCTCFFFSSRVNQGNLLTIMLFYAKISACIQVFWCKVWWGKPNRIWSTPFNLTGRRMCLLTSQMCWITGNRRAVIFLYHLLTSLLKTQLRLNVWDRWEPFDGPMPRTSTSFIASCWNMAKMRKSTQMLCSCIKDTLSFSR